MSVAACGGKDTTPEPTPPPSTVNHAPLISGEAPVVAVTGDAYTFTPNVSDADGDALQFSAARLPRWARLDPLTGKLTGNPQPGDEGVYSAITIRVSDGRAEAALPAFTIEVTQHAPGRALLSWALPTQRADGTALSDLTGYRIEYGRDRSDLDHFLLIGNPSINSVEIERLPLGTWYFAVVALDSRSIESEPSRFVSIKIT